MTMAQGSRVRPLSNIEPWAFAWPWENTFWGLRYASIGDWHRAATHIWAPAKRTPSVRSCERAAKAARGFDDAMTQALAGAPEPIEFDRWRNFTEEAQRLREHVLRALGALEAPAMRAAGRATA